MLEFLLTFFVIQESGKMLLYLLLVPGSLTRSRMHRGLLH